MRRDKPSDDPSTWRRSFVVRINDGLSPVLVPRLISQITGEAPGVRLRFVTDDSDDPEALRSGSIDLDIGLADTPAPDVHVEGLLVDRPVAVVSARSKMGRARRLTVAQLCSHPHIASARSGSVSASLDDALEKIGRSRRVVAVAPSYAVAALLALEDDVIVVIPSMLARHLVDRGVPVRWHELPLALPSTALEQRWHRRLDADGPTQWLRHHVTTALGPLASAAG